MIENKYTNYKDFIMNNCRHLYITHGVFIDKKTYSGLRRFYNRHGICYDFSNAKKTCLFYVGVTIGIYRYTLNCIKVQGSYFLKLKKYFA